MMALGTKAGAEMTLEYKKRKEGTYILKVLQSLGVLLLGDIANTTIVKEESYVLPLKASLVGVDLVIKPVQHRKGCLVRFGKNASQRKGGVLRGNVVPVCEKGRGKDELGANLIDGRLQRMHSSNGFLRILTVLQKPSAHCGN
jgi:hypothetical protein